MAEQQWERSMLQTMMAELKEQVSELNYRVLEMRMIEQRDVQDVAQTLNIKPEQVRYRQHRTLAKLRAAIAVYTGDNFGE